jgi:CBS domain-containing protein
MSTGPVTRPRTRRDPGDLNTITVAEVMNPGIVSCSQTASATEIARVMASCRVHCVAVIGLSHDSDPQPRIWGIVSDLDVLRSVTDPASPATAQELAQQPVITVRPETTIYEAVEAMVRYGAHHIVVADPELHTPLGILSTLDVAEILGQGKP